MADRNEIVKAMANILSIENGLAQQLKSDRYFDAYYEQRDKAMNMRFGYEDLLNALFPGENNDLSPEALTVMGF